MGWQVLEGVPDSDVQQLLSIARRRVSPGVITASMWPSAAARAAPRCSLA